MFVHYLITIICDLVSRTFQVVPWLLFTNQDCTFLSTRSADGTALGLFPNDCRKQRLKSGGVAVWMIAWFNVLGALGLIPKDD
ncbi:hypothetical protein ACFXTH_011550 [Malus domestica]